MPAWAIVVIAVIGLPVLATMGCVVCGIAAGMRGATNATATATAPSAGVDPVVTSPAPATAAPKVPRDPRAPLADKADEAPKLEAEMLADSSYGRAWDGKHADEVNLFMTAVSEVIVGELNDAEGQTSIQEDVARALERKKLINAILKVAGYEARTGRLPDDLARKVEAQIAAVTGSPHLGLWVPYKPGAVPIDFAALAAWMHPEDPRYLREFIAARKAKAGPFGWSGAKGALRPYLTREKAALERLAKITSLTSAEAARLAELKASKLGDEPAERVEIGTLLSEYHDNEVRADGRWKGHVIEVTGIVGTVKKDITNSIFVTLGTGKMFEVPEVQAFFDDRYAQKAAALTKGDRVTIRGRVRGLMMNVLVRDAEFSE